MSTDNIFQRIIQSYGSLTRMEQKVADYILNHKEGLPYIYIADLAAACGVGISTVTRFCHTVGCRSFNDFKVKTAQALSVGDSTVLKDAYDLYGEMKASDDIAQKCQKLYRIGIHALKQTVDLLDPNTISKAVDLLCTAKNVYCLGQGNSSTIAMDAWGRFISVATKFHWVTDYHMQSFTTATLGAGDVILYFSFSGAMRELSELGRLVRQTEGKLILVTRFPNSPGAAYADLVIVCGVNESPRQQGSIAVKLGQLFIIDLLYQEYCARNPETTEENREKTLNATNPMLL